MTGRSRPKRALSASEPCPGGTTGMAWACMAGFAAAPVSDCGAGFLGAEGAMLPLGGNRLCAGPGGTPGTSLGGRGAGLGELEKNWALATAGSAASHKAAATTSWHPRPDLVPPVPQGQGFDRHTGTFLQWR